MWRRPSGKRFTILLITNCSAIQRLALLADHAAGVFAGDVEDDLFGVVANLDVDLEAHAADDLGDHLRRELGFAVFLRLELGRVRDRARAAD